MNQDVPANEEIFDISGFEIPPAAAYFETIQQLQKVNAKLDVLLQGQSEIKAALMDRDASAELERMLSSVAKRYEALLLRYFEGTDISPAAIRQTIHDEDRTNGEDPASWRHTPVIS